MRLGLGLELGSGGSIWLASSIAGLTLDLDPAHGITLNSGNVSSAVDQSGTGNNFTQGTGANQPPWINSGIGGMPCFDTRTVTSAAAFLSCVNNVSSILTGGVGATCITVLQAKEPQGGGTFPGDFSRLWGTAGSDDFLPFTNEAGGLFDGFASTTRQSIGTTIDIHTAPVVYTATSTNGNWTAYINGTSVFTTGTNTYTNGGAQIPTFLGQTASSGWWQGLCARRLVYNRVLTAAEIAASTAGLRSLYSI